MKKVDGWYFPDGESHLPQWMANPKVRMFLNGRAAYQGQKQRTAMDLCAQKRTAVDVGGHIGLWSWNLAHAFRSVAAFEPVSVHRECFLMNMKGLDNVTLHDCALGETPGNVSIRTEPTSSGDSRVDGEGVIPLCTLDSFELKEVDLLKIDTEGFELFVLKGALETLVRCKPVICVEQKPGHARRFGLGDCDAVPFLKDLGYEVRKEMSGDFLLVHNGK